MTSFLSVATLVGFVLAFVTDRFRSSGLPRGRFLWLRWGRGGGSACDGGFVSRSPDRDSVTSSTRALPVKGDSPTGIARSG